MPAPASPAVSAADITAQYGQRPLHQEEHSAISTVSSRVPVISGTLARHPAPATGSMPVHGFDDIKSTRARHDAPSLARSAPLLSRRLGKRPRYPRRGPATSDGTGRVFLPQIRSRQRRP